MIRASSSYWPSSPRRSGSGCTSRTTTTRTSSRPCSCTSRPRCWSSTTTRWPFRSPRFLSWPSRSTRGRAPDRDAVRHQPAGLPARGAAAGPDLLLRGGRPPAHGQSGDIVSRMFAGFAQWVRDEMVVPVMGKEHRDQVPALLPVGVLLHPVHEPPGAGPRRGHGDRQHLRHRCPSRRSPSLAMLVCGMIVQGTAGLLEEPGPARAAGRSGR